MANLKELVSLSNKYGSDPELVLAGGGNTSVKDAEYLYIKGSGTTLATITADGFVKMDRNGLSRLFTTEYPKDPEDREAEVLKDIMAARAPGEENKRPSVETPLHNLFPQRYVVHTHPAIVNGLTCSKNGREESIRLFGDKAIWINLTQPGYILAQTVKKAMDGYKVSTGHDANIVILQNHGIFIAGDSPEDIDENYAYVLDTITSAVDEVSGLYEVPYDREKADLLLGFLESQFDEDTILFTANNLTDKFIGDSDSFYPVSSIYTPDHMVYYKQAPLYVESAKDAVKQCRLISAGQASFEKKYGYPPKIIAVSGLGFYSIGRTLKAAEISKALFLDTLKIASYNTSFGGPRFMTKEMIDFIANWEVESYRQSVSK